MESGRGGDRKPLKEAAQFAPAMAEESQRASGVRLEDPEALRQRRDTVLGRYQGFKEAARVRREKLEAAKKYQQFRRDADELESWISEKMQAVSDDPYKDRTNLQVRACLRFGRCVCEPATQKRGAELNLQRLYIIPS